MFKIVDTHIDKFHVSLGLFIFLIFVMNDLLKHVILVLKSFPVIIVVMKNKQEYAGDNRIYP